MLVINCVCVRGLYVTINDIDHVYEILCNWPETDVKVFTTHVCLTDKLSAVCGL